MLQQIKVIAFSRRLLIKVLLISSFYFAVNAFAQVSPPPIAAKSWLLFDMKSQQVLVSSNADARVEPASLTKIMTAYLVFSALHDGKITLEQMTYPTPIALSATGAKMHLRPKQAVSVKDLLQGMIVVSGNDATLTLAELVAGSQEKFVASMNAQAKKMGLRNTQFANPHGLSMPGHYASARDLALLTQRLINDFPREYATYYSQKKFTYNQITQDNRNSLLFKDAKVDGVKTGQTNNAGFCLIASSERRGRRLISVVLGAASLQSRTEESQKLLNYGFQKFTAIKFYDAKQVLKELDVLDAGKKKLEIGLKYPLWVSTPNGSTAGIQALLDVQTPLNAPIFQGQVVGRIRLSLKEYALAEHALVALNHVDKLERSKSWFEFKSWFE